MYCTVCHYDLTGLRSSRCPECGVPFNANNPTTWRPVPYTNTRFTVLFFLALACAPFAGALVRVLLASFTGSYFWDF